VHNLNWTVKFHDEFEPEFEDMPELLQDELLARLRVLERWGPDLGRPHVETLKGSKFANMKELRFGFDGSVWRIGFAFDPTRKAIVLVAGNKSGVNQIRFYKGLVHIADQRYKKHLEQIG